MDLHAGFCQHPFEAFAYGAAYENLSSTLQNGTHADQGIAWRKLDPALHEKSLRVETAHLQTRRCIEKRGQPVIVCGQANAGGSFFVLFHSSNHVQRVFFCEAENMPIKLLFYFNGMAEVCCNCNEAGAEKCALQAGKTAQITSGRNNGPAYGGGCLWRCPVHGR